MDFTRLSDQDYQAFVAAQERCFYTQLPEYGDVREAEGFAVERVGLVRGGEVRGVATIVYQPWKKLFRRAVVPYGPVLDWSDKQLVQDFFEHLRGWVERDRKVLTLRVNPLLRRRDYRDITPSDTNGEALFFDEVMESIGGKRVTKEFYESSDIQVRFVYVKDLASMDYNGVAASCHQTVRTAFRKVGTNGVTVKFLGPDDFHILEGIMDHTAERTEMEAVTPSMMSYYRDLMTRMGPEGVLMPAAVLSCPDALRQLADERTQINAEISNLESAETAAHEQGRQLGKKQRNRLKELRARVDVIDRRTNETESIRNEYGDDVVLAASLFVHSPHELVYLLSGSYSQFQSYSGIYLIHRAMIEWALEHDVRWYNMFGLTGDFTEDASDAGVLHFKRQFNGDVEEYVGTYDIPLRKCLASALDAMG